MFAMGSVLIAMRVKQNSFTAIGVSIVSLLGCVLLAAIPGTPRWKLLPYYLTWAQTGVGALLLTIVSNNVSGYTKKVFYNSVNMVGMTLGNFIGPLLMLENQAPTYYGAMIAYAVSNVVIIACIFVVYYLMKKENARRLANPPATKTDVHLDLTDLQDRNIIYKL
jgi:large-conductance mechanosensitive channel